MTAYECEHHGSQLGMLMCKHILKRIDEKKVRDISKYKIAKSDAGYIVYFCDECIERFQIEDNFIANSEISEVVGIICPGCAEGNGVIWT